MIMWILTTILFTVGAGVSSSPAENPKGACRLNPDPSVVYTCVTSDGAAGTRPCQGIEPDGTVVIPTCNAPNYYYSSNLAYMRCISGSWDYIARCKAECGIITPEGSSLLRADEKPAVKHHLPWHATIYKKKSEYLQICSGSLVSSKLVISAAHCFWNEQKQEKEPASLYAVALGKTKRQWLDRSEDESRIQRSDVKEVNLPPYYLGHRANFQNDLAIVQLVDTITFTPNIRPVCINFDLEMQRKDLVEGNIGEAATWGFEGRDGKLRDKALQTVTLPYVPIEQCLQEIPVSFRQYITADKICAGSRNGSTLCFGDGGAGLVFPSYDQGIVARYFLRGVTSAAPADDGEGCIHQLIAFTQLSKLEDFVKMYF